MDTEKMLEKCGDFGRYQYLIMAMFCVVNIICAMDYYSQTIISFVPEHWCYSDAYTNKTYDEIREIASKLPDPSCSVLTTLNKTEPNNEALCNEWIYNLDFGYQSMTSELDWVCHNAWKSTIGQSMFFVGSVVGTTCFGFMADRLGRLPVLVFAHIMACFGNAATIFATDATSFAIFRFLSGMATDSNFTLMYILVMEYIRPSKRTFGLNLSIGLFYCIGSVITPWVAVGLGTWRLFLITAAATTMLVPFYYFIMSESALWLISKNRIDDAIHCFKRVARINGQPLTENDVAEFRKMSALQINNSENQFNSNLIDLFKTARLRKNMLILLLTSMVITLCYDAISRNVEGLGISPFIMFSISSSAILPACLTLLLLQDKIGRKAMATSSLLVSGIFIAATGIIISYNAEKSPYMLVSLAVLGRYGVVVAYNSLAQFCTELIPTCVRGQGVAVVHVAGYAFTFLSAYILYLANIFKPLPFLILGGISLLGSISILFLPETLNRVLPTTIQDGEEFGLIEKTKL